MAGGGHEVVFADAYTEPSSSDLNRPLLAHSSQTGRNLWIGRFLVAFWAVTTILAIVFRRQVGGFIRKIAVWASEQGHMVYVYYLAIFILSVPLFMSVELLLLASGFIFSHIHGPFVGILVGTGTSFVGYFFATLICYLLSRYFLRGLVTKCLRSYRYFDALNRAAEKDGLAIVAIIRLSPLFPAAIVSYIFGSTKIGLGDYCLGSFTCIPSLAFFTYVGSLLQDLTSDAGAGSDGTNWRSAIFLCLAVAASLVAIYYTSILTRRHLHLDEAANGVGAIDGDLANVAVGDAEAGAPQPGAGAGAGAASAPTNVAATRNDTAASTG